jgi:hypothetical protein
MHLPAPAPEEQMQGVPSATHRGGRGREGRGRGGGGVSLGAMKSASSDSQHFKSLRRGVLRAFWGLKTENGVFFFGQKSFSTSISLFSLVCPLSHYLCDIRVRGERFSALQKPQARGFKGILIDSQHFKSLRRGVLRAFWGLKTENGVF